ncbi:hypothetical protein E2C01_029179 [Portunus trituberculatus]|uniref:Uncharacterized protein n=1 Tax=Portunus trituberculatus TaxID=210409 RepID=A0A5B7ERA1_PORTR|nr:hypothetical protein [Portunus trituberculatus]
MSYLFLSFIAIFMLTVLLILLTALLTASLHTRLSSSSHPFSIQLSNARVNQYSKSFIPFTGKLWNTLPASVLIFFFLRLDFF